MADYIILKNKFPSFDKKITVASDKSLSIRWILFASIANGVSKARNLLNSEDVKATKNVIKKLGIKIYSNKDTCKIYGNGIDGYKYKKNITLNAGNSGTLGRLILGLLSNTPNSIKIIGDKSLSKRDFKRVTDPLEKFGVKFILKNNKNLPLFIKGSSNLKPIKYFEKKGSAQCKSALIFAGMRSEGTTYIKAKKSRNHTELLCKYLNLPIKINTRGKYDMIEVKKVNKINPLKYDLPSDISSSAFFMVLTALSNNSNLIIKNVNINPSRTGVITILKKMGVKIILKNVKNYKGEKNADIKIQSANKIIPINCPTSLNTSAIDEFLLIFLVAAKANGVSYFKNLEELNQKESPRLIWGSKILKQIGIRTIITKKSIKIYGNPNLIVNKKIIIKNFLKDHRVFMTCVIAALSFGGKWKIYDKESINTSFPNFLKIIKSLKS